MPRKPRAYVAGLPCHVIQRGNNHSDCFFSNEDYHIFLNYLDDACQRYDVALHAYVLMSNHSHLLMTPNCKEGISKVMQSLGRRYVQYINKRLRRSGTLWEGRHKASVVDADSYLLACYRYIELNPVRAGIVEHPGDYPWSSYCANAQGLENSRLTPHPLYMALGATGRNSYSAYRKLFSHVLDDQLVHGIRIAACFSMPLGSNQFKQKIEKLVNQKLGYVKRGRPAGNSRKLIRYQFD